MSFRSKARTMVYGSTGDDAHQPSREVFIDLMSDVDTLQEDLEGRIEGAAEGVVSALTWTALDAITGTRDGQPGRVAASDNSVHTDPVTSKQVRNKGDYAWNLAEQEWQRIGESPDQAISPGLLLDPIALGASAETDGSAGTSSNNWVNPVAVGSDGYLEGLTVYSRTAHTIDVNVYKKIGSNYYLVDGVAAAIGTGVQTVDCHMRVYAGEFVGFRTSVLNSVAYESGGTYDYGAYASNSFAVTSISITPKAQFSLSLVEGIGVRPGPLVVVVSAGTYGIRSRFNADEDLVMHLTPDDESLVMDGGIGDRKIPADTAPSQTLSAAAIGALVKSANDDAPPLWYNGTILGANHGVVCYRVTKSGHGKANVDIGSTWAESGKNWVLARVDGNDLYFIAETGGTATLWTISNAMAGTTLTHVTGATNTGSIDATVKASDQFFPLVQNLERTVTLDGTPITADGVYSGTQLVMTESYGIPNVASVITYLQSRTGSTDDGHINLPSIQTQAMVRQSRIYTPEGSWAGPYNVEFVQPVTPGASSAFVGGQQAMALYNDTDDLFLYIPRTTTNSDTGLDPSTVVDITTLSASMIIDSAEWTDANDPPERIAQFIVDGGGDRIHGFMMGYSKRIGDSVKTVRDDLINRAFNINQISKKMYPSLVYGAVSSISAGDSFSCLTYRGHFDPRLDPLLTTKVIYPEGRKSVLVLDTHEVLTRHWVSLPDRFQGCDVTVVEASASLTVHSDFVEADGICISNSSGIGELVLLID